VHHPTLEICGKNYKKDIKEEILHRIRTVNDSSIEYSDNIFNKVLIEIEDIYGALTLTWS